MREWDLGQEIHVFVLFEDGALFQTILEDKDSPGSCSNPHRISLSLLNSYDYSALRKNKPAKVLDSAEVARHWRAIQDNPLEYDVKVLGTTHGAMSCSFAVVGQPNKQLTELRLIQYRSWFFDILPRREEQEEAANWLWKATYHLAQKAAK